MGRTPLPDRDAAAGEAVADAAVRDGAAIGWRDGQPNDARANADGPMTTTRRLALNANHLVADPVRGLLYATVPGQAKTHPNTLVVVDPMTASVVTAVPVGSDPNVLAIADDSSTLWVSLDGAYAVRRVSLTTTTPTPEAQFPLPHPATPDGVTAFDMVLLGGRPRSLVISLRDPAGNFEKMAWLEDGVPRRTEGPPDRGPYRLAAGPAGWVFGGRSLYGGSDFFTFQALPEGLTEDSFSGLLTDSPISELTYHDGRIFDGGGAVVDVRDPVKPVRAGRFVFRGAIAPWRPRPRILMLSPSTYGNPKGASLRVLDPETFNEVVSTSMAGLHVPFVWDLVTVGDKLVAFLARPDDSMGSQAALYIVQHALPGGP